MSSDLRLASTFHFNDRPGDNHLYVVASDLSAPEVVIFSITTQYRLSDVSCQLLEGDHTFIKHPSCISYQHAELIPLATLEAKLAGGAIVLRDKCSSDVMRKIWDGAETTRHLQGWVREILAAQGIISE